MPEGADREIWGSESGLSRLLGLALRIGGADGRPLGLRRDSWPQSQRLHASICVVVVSGLRRAKARRCTAPLWLRDFFQVF